MGHSGTLVIKADPDPQEAKAVCRKCLDEINTSGPITVEFDADSPNIFALQIALSCMRSLQQTTQFAGFGPVAQRVLGEFLKSEPPVKAMH